MTFGFEMGNLSTNESEQNSQAGGRYFDGQRLRLADDESRR
jgi:hypothetical protein